jgi:hypothetical protein
MPVSPLDSTQYFVCDNTEVWIHPTILTQATPAPTQRAIIATATTIVAGTTTLTATTATTSKLYDKQRIVLPSGQVMVIDASAQAVDAASGARFFPVGTTALKIYPALVGLTLPATTPYEELQPLWSVDMANFASEGTIIDFKNFGAGPYKSKRKTSLDSTFDTDGFVTRIDPMLDLIRQAAQLTDAFLKIRFIPPDSKGMEFTAQVASDSRQTKDGDPYRAPFKFAPSAPTLFNFLPS